MCSLSTGFFFFVLFNPHIEIMLLFLHQALILLVCSADGIQTNDFSNLLGDIDKKEPLAPLYWARTRRILKPYIKEIGTRENISFYHMEIHKVKSTI